MTEPLLWLRAWQVSVSAQWIDVAEALSLVKAVPHQIAGAANYVTRSVSP
ncbi:MAG: hypothetical protein HC936_07830 [Leptolyngbyaceae cyanobacterium SU_3_3]|nr:hypothetical protein [Leptolyngbyaceae cyanobacterium SU_3_3]NJR50654.1 hypothetical protein [Leptolyngbyaceae cyanobacterium CSU_1_3]